MENAVVVLYPSPGMGHLVAMVEIGKLILTHQPSLSIVVLMTTFPFDTRSTTPYITRVSATIPSITFHHLPTIPLPLPNSNSHFIDLAFELPRLHNPNVHKILHTISQKSTLKAFIIDFFCTAASQVSATLNIPTYYFSTSGATTLSAFLHLPTIHETTSKSYKDLNTYLEFPGTRPVHTRDMAEALFDRSSNSYKKFISTSSKMAKSSGIITNTFEAFEPRAVKAISDGRSIPNGPTPPVYHIGPLIASDDRTRCSEHECLIWLDSQPSRSVVFLCFGSMGLIKEEQLKEMAIGLENSGLRFLWVVRNPPSHDSDLGELLPRGFLERTRDKGLVVKSWTPQVDVLSHDSVGGFVTHCGWNSVLEAVCAGVPMVAWPLYAEQRMNRVFMVEEYKVALTIHESEDGFVSADELEKRVRDLMGEESGKAIRDQVMAMRDAAKAALGERGSSRVALAKLIESWN